MPALLSLLAVIAFLPTIPHGFVSDDVGNFLRNPAFGPLSWEGIRYAFRATTLGVYQPFAWLFAEAQCSLFGLNAKGYHAVSVLLHAANVVSFHFLLVAAGLPSFAAVALFAVHPLNTEAVAWISCQPYLLCAFFLLNAMRFHLLGREGLTALFFVFALLSKAPAVMFPLVLLIVDKGRSWQRKLPLFTLSTVFAVLALWARDTVDTGPAYSLPGRLVQAGYGLFYLVSRAVCPLGLAGFFTRPPEMELASVAYVVPAFLAIVAVVFAVRRSWVFAVPLVLLLPNLGLVGFSNALVADRYFYLASLAVFAMLRKPAFALAVLVLLPLTWRENGIWKDNGTFWTAVVARGHGDANAHFQLGYALATEGRLVEAEVALTTALRSEASVAQKVRWLNDYGVLLRERKTSAVAVPWLNLAVALDPKNAVAANTLGTLLFDLSFLSAAEARFRDALAARPDYGEARENLEKLEEMKRQLAKDTATAKGSQLGVVLALQGRYDEALRQFEASDVGNLSTVNRLRLGPPRDFPPGFAPRDHASEH